MQMPGVRADRDRYGFFLHALLLALLAVLSLSTGCSQLHWQPAGPAVGAPRLEEQRVVTADGYSLPLHTWLPEGEPSAVLLGLHGFNDYGNAFAVLKEALVEDNGIAIYAYDQRGFGATRNTGIWPGTETLVADARTLVMLLRERYPDRPLYLAGESMGAAVALLVLAERPSPPVDGAVLIAPAVWGYDSMPWYQRLALWLSVHLMPGKYYKSEITRKLGIQPTDDPEVSRQLSEDPLVQKGARVDTLYGAAELMDDASKVTTLPGPALILYAPEDEVIPAKPLCVWLQRMNGNPNEQMRILLYPNGFHMLTRYTGGARVITDIAAWMGEPDGNLPSGQEHGLEDARTAVCK